MSEFFDWLADNSWMAWATGGLLLVIAELLSLDLVLLMLGVGAFAGAAGAVLGAPAFVNVLLAIVVATGMLVLVRPSFLKRLHSGPGYPDGQAALLGKTAVVTVEISRTGGRVEMDGEEWTARAALEGETVPVGTMVSVFEIDGATAVVYPQD